MAYETPQEQANELLATGLIQPAQTIAQQATALLATGQFQPSESVNTPVPVQVNDGNIPPNVTIVLLGTLDASTLPQIDSTTVPVTLIVVTADNSAPVVVSGQGGATMSPTGANSIDLQGQGTAKTFYPNSSNNTWLVY